MRTSNKFDSENNEIFEGDKVIHSWGWFTWNGEHKIRYRIHTITVNDAYLMGDGQMHDDGGGIIFCLGKSYNFWEGKTVTKLTTEEVEKIGMKDDVDFFFDDNKIAVKFTDQHFMGISNEEWDLEMKRRNDFEYKMFFGEQ
ncbi:hypothetical protein [uncultured Clostridium sp.]|uniref:hypothetical protein n=1 Tax=uncultured Clostridium sp. TaxID=59620 RepID=UPI00261AB388|nr:hypothetical protein [uncultured Clostridium sp.]